MTETIQIGDIVIAVTRKDIKNVHLSVHPPTGRVRIAAPEHMDIDKIRLARPSEGKFVDDPDMG